MIQVLVMLVALSVILYAAAIVAIASGYVLAGALALLGAYLCHRSASY